MIIFHVDQLRGFLGLPPAEDAPVYQELVAALDRVLESVERVVRQFPAERLGTPLQIPPGHLTGPPPVGRSDIRQLAFNIHDPIGRMRKALDSGDFDWDPIVEEEREKSRHFTSVEEVADFCRSTREPWLERAAAVSDQEATESASTPRGPLTHLQILEAQAIHSARHLRQIYVYLRSFGIEPKQPLSDGDMRPIPVGELIF